MAAMFKDHVVPYFVLSLLELLDILVFETYNKPLFGIWIGFAIIPIVDQLIPVDKFNPSLEEQNDLKKQKVWKLPILAFCLVDWAYFLWSVSKVVSGTLSTPYTIALLISCGHSSALGFLAAHETFHKKDATSRVLGTLHMSKSLYMHFFIEHVYGHHKNVATPFDGATAKMGQSLFSFVRQSVLHTTKNSWDIEVARLGSPWTLQNRHFWFWGVEVALAVGVCVVFGIAGLGFFLAQAGISVFLLECINYVEHYGLERKEIASGVYEPVSIKHSWNAPQSLQNLFLLKLQRHSDHHENSLKPYQTLCSYEDSPTLPCGYGICITSAFCPPIWFAMIDPLAKQANEKGNVSKEDINKSGLVLKSFAMLQSCVMSMVFLLI